MRWALDPRISLPTGVRRRRPMTMRSASVSLATEMRSSAGSLPRTSWRTSTVSPCAGQLVLGPLELGLGRLDAVVVEVTTAAVGVDDDEWRLARLGLLDRPREGGPPLLGGNEPDDDGHDVLLGRTSPAGRRVRPPDRTAARPQRPPSTSRITPPTCSVSMRKPSWPCREVMTDSPVPGRAAAISLGQPQRVEAVGRDPRDVEGALEAAQGGVEAAPAAADVVAVHRLGEHDVAVGVEPARQLRRVVVEVALDVVAAAAPERVLPVRGRRPKRSSSSPSWR